MKSENETDNECSLARIFLEPYRIVIRQNLTVVFLGCTANLMIFIKKRRPPAVFLKMSYCAAILHISGTETLSAVFSAVL